MSNIAYIGVGSNLGDKIKFCNEAIEEISNYRENVILRRSSFYRTEPWGKENQGWFINSVIQIETPFSALNLLKFLQDIEKKLKRKKEKKWCPRTIDLDILFFNNEIIKNAEIQIPHPRIQDRRFVLIPLSEISPELIHPVLNASIEELLEKTLDRKEVVKIGRIGKIN